MGDSRGNQGTPQGAAISNRRPNEDGDFKSPLLGAFADLASQGKSKSLWQKTKSRI
jgi:hypothetical protein